MSTTEARTAEPLLTETLLARHFGLHPARNAPCRSLNPEHADHRIRDHVDHRFRGHADHFLGMERNG